jgi:NAD(P)-dependent dehydrogenase (short-subunit alcohol dehydrogenase family)
MNESTTALITGATSGIGRATALLLARNGYRVFATGRTPRDLESLKQDAKDLPIETLVLDVTQAESIEAARAEVERLTGGKNIDVLINNAGFAVGGPAELVTDADLRAQFEVNVFGLMSVTRAFVPAMRKRGSGRVVNLSSLASRFTFPLLGTYASTKFAVRSLTDALRNELRPFGIQVTAIEPGVVKTPFITRTMDEAAKYRRNDSPYWAAIERADQLQADSEKTACGPEVIAGMILKALRARKMKAHYAGPLLPKLGIAFINLLPVFIQDALMSKLSGVSGIGKPRLPTHPQLNEGAHHG